MVTEFTPLIPCLRSLLIVGELTDDEKLSRILVRKAMFFFKQPFINY